jgi:hypothetical protein
MQCISNIEKLHYSKESQLFTSISCESQIGEGYVSILTSDCPGFTPEDPMMFIELPFPEYSTFNKQMRVISKCQSKVKSRRNIMLTCFTVYNPSANPNWLFITVGDIVRTTNDEPWNQSYVIAGSEFKGSDSII